MTAVMWGAAVLAAILHVVFFCAESLWWEKPAVTHGFQMTAEDARTTRLIAFNQGFYNLMLALGVFAGLFAWIQGQENVGLGIAAWSCLSMVVAGLVLIASAPNLKSGAFVQIAPPLVFLVFLGLRLAA
ncbi:MAG TPA: DUF1304 domain-containing protein [Actinomycetota bacterium]|nr:DUF1304 domain-containing protein [Actinomycetota bacterium]